MYHGTADSFTIFDPKKFGGKNGTQEGLGIYLTDNKEVSDAYGEIVLKGYANITHPATSYSQVISKRDLVKLIKRTCEIEAQNAVDDGEYETLQDAIRDTWISE